MATFSTMLGLKLNAQSDPFQLSDFIGNWNILDQSPGTYICTSTTRPSWSSGQAGRLIFMTDLKQLAYWDGANWQDPRSAAPLIGGGTYLAANIGPNAQPNFNILTFTIPRPGAMMCWASCTYNYPNNKTQDAYQNMTLDGATTQTGNFREQIRFAGNSGDSSASAGMNVGTFAIAPAVNAGTHTLGVKIQMGSYPVSITLVGVKVFAMLSIFTNNNVL